MNTILLWVFLWSTSFCISVAPVSMPTFTTNKNVEPFTEVRRKRQSGVSSCSKLISDSAEYPRDCCDILTSCSGQSPPSGQYYIQPEGATVMKVYCDMDTEGGGWTVFQRRIDGTIKFYRSWSHYKNGFGNLNAEFWLGLENIYYLTTQRDYELRIDMINTKEDHYYAKYSTFRIGDSYSEYILAVGTYSGTAGDSLSYHNTMRFSTYDNDNDVWSSNCAKHKSHGLGGWWYKDCTASNLNGNYYVYNGKPSVYWSKLPGDTDHIPFVEMKIRPRTTY